MLNTNLERYIKENLSKGYDINTLRSTLVKWGYNINDIDPIITKLIKSKKPQQPQETEPQSPKKENNFLNIFLRPTTFFENPNNYSFKKSLKYLSYSVLVFFLTNPSIPFLIGLFKKNSIALLLATILTNTLSNFLFLLSLSIFCILLVTLLFLSFKYLVKTELSFNSLLTILLFSLTPYILINSINNLNLYPLISLTSVSIGFLNINAFFVWSLFIFSLGASKKSGIDFKKNFVFVFVPFLVLMAILIVVFLSAVKLNFLWFVLEKF